MQKAPKLYMILLGCRPEGRNTEQHDIYFGIANSLSELIPSMYEFWPEAKMELHIDAWREVTKVGDFKIEIQSREGNLNPLEKQSKKLFFVNLGGYKKGEFEEFHYKILTVAESLDSAKTQAKEHTFFKHTGFKGANSHVDDKHGIDIDEMYSIEDILHQTFKIQFKVSIYPASIEKDDPIHLGYLPLSSI